MYVLLCTVYAQELTCRWYSPLQRPKTRNSGNNSINNNTRISGRSSFSVILEIRGHTTCILKNNNNDNVYSAVIMTVTTCSRGSFDKCGKVKSFPTHLGPWDAAALLFYSRQPDTSLHCDCEATDTQLEYCAACLFISQLLLVPSYTAW